MIQILLLVYGVVALFRGMWSVGKGKKVVGRRARILGLICVMSLPTSLMLGFITGVLVSLGVMEMPNPGALMLIDIGVVIATVIVVVVLGKRFYRAQEEEILETRGMELSSSPAVSGEQFSIADPDNPYASPAYGDRR